MSRENLLWGTPRIHGEFLKLGYRVTQSTVAKYMIKAMARCYSAGRPSCAVTPAVPPQSICSCFDHRLPYALRQPPARRHLLRAVEHEAKPQAEDDPYRDGAADNRGHALGGTREAKQEPDRAGHQVRAIDSPSRDRGCLRRLVVAIAPIAFMGWIGNGVL